MINSGNLVFPFLSNYSDDLTIRVNYLLNCSCKCLGFCNSSLNGILTEIDPYTGVTLRNIALSGISSVSLSSLTIFKTNLKYGVYYLNISFTMNLFQKDSYGLFLLPATATIVKYTQTYFKIVPTGFLLAALNSDLFQNGVFNQIDVGILDSISFVPVFFSRDLDSFVDPNSLEFNFYCQLVPKNQVLNNFNQDLYSIKQETGLTSEQIKSENTCFKSDGLIITLKIQIRTLI